jgi:serine/threonine protein kinase
LSSDTNDQLPFIANRYEVKYRLGEGGMGVVYKASDNHLSKDVAIKLLKNTADRQSILRFQKEAKLCAKLSHAYILNALDFGATEDGHPYLVLDYLDGNLLSEYIKTKGRLSIEETLTLLAQICVAMSYAHDKEILHRDLKPSNVMLIQKPDGSHSIKLMDFGVATLLSVEDPSMQKLTKTGAGLGSPLYMSPEQAQGNKADKSSDIYSVGCIAYEMLTGEVPIRGDTVYDTIRLKSTIDTLPLSQKVPGLVFPEPVEKLVAKCLSRTSNNRFQTFKTVHQEVMRLLHNDKKDEELAETEIIQKNPKFQRSTPIAIAVIALSVISALVVGLIQLFEEKSSIVDKPLPSTTEKKFPVLPEYPGEVNTRNRGAIAISEVTVDSNWLTAERDRVFKEVGWAKRTRRFKFVKCTLQCSVPEILQKFPLVNLACIDCTAGDKNFREIEKMSTLTEFCVVRCSPGITTQTLRPLLKLNLERLEIEQPSLTDSDLEIISQMKGLTNLRITGNGISEKGVRQLAKLTELNTLLIGGETFETNMLNSIAKLPKLASLDFVRLEPGQIGDVSKLAPLPKLTNLNFTRCTLRGKDLESLDKLEKLRCIGLSKVNLDESGFKKILRNHKIKEIQLIGRNNLSHEQTKALAYKPGLERLGIGVTDSIFKEIESDIRRDRPNLKINLTN